jgi:hypothetical protein
LLIRHIDRVRVPTVDRCPPHDARRRDRRQDWIGNGQQTRRFAPRLASVTIGPARSHSRIGNPAVQ